MKLTTTKGKNQKLVNFQVFPDSAHQAELERYQGQMKLDDKYQIHGSHDKNWIPHIKKNNHSDCKIDTKNKGYQEIMFFDCKIQLEKVHLKNDTIIYQ